MRHVERPNRRRSAVLALALATGIPFLGLAEDGGAPDAGDRRALEVRTVEGTISALVPAEHSVTVDTEAGPVRLAIDRNTSVFLPSRLGTVRELTLGARVRASFGQELRAFWIEVRRPADDADRPPGAGKPRATGAGPPALPAPRTREGGVTAAPPEASDGGSAPRPDTEVPAGPGGPGPEPGGTPIPPFPPLGGSER